MRRHKGLSFLRIRRIRWVSGLSVLVLFTVYAGWNLAKTKDHQDRTAEEKAQLVSAVSDWIRAERDRQRPRALPLDASELSIFEPYFPREVLEKVRVRAVDEMPSPRVVDEIRHQGRRVFDLSRARGMALDDTILLLGADGPPGSPSRRSVLFHELVHATQYHYLGVDSFMREYFASLEAGGYRYPDIVFEAQAFELQHRFVTSLGDPFSVDEEVRAQVRSLLTREE